MPNTQLIKIQENRMFVTLSRGKTKHRKARNAVMLYEGLQLKVEQ